MRRDSGRMLSKTSAVTPGPGSRRFGAPAAGSAVVEGAFAGALPASAPAPPNVAENDTIDCGTPSSSSSKSDARRSGTGCPRRSRTTTSTSTARAPLLTTRPGACDCCAGVPALRARVTRNVKGTTRRGVMSPPQARRKPDRLIHNPQHRRPRYLLGPLLHDGAKLVGACWKIGDRQPPELLDAARPNRRSRAATEPARRICRSAQARSRTPARARP